MSLRDFNFFNGDLIIGNEKIDTDDGYSADVTITNRLKTLIYKVLIYKNVLKNKFLGRRITDLTALENEIKNFCFEQFYVYYPLEDLALLVNIECIILNQTANLYFYYYDSNKKIVLLSNYEITI